MRWRQSQLIKVINPELKVEKRRVSLKWKGKGQGRTYGNSQQILSTFAEEAGIILSMQ